MAISLDGIALPDDLQWSNEFDWSPVSQSAEYSIGGALMVQEGTKLVGRPILITGGNWAWVTRSTVKALFATLIANKVMTLITDDGRTFPVMWNHEDKPIETEPVKFQSPPDDDDDHFITLRLFEVT